MSEDFKGKVALVTGGASGIGRSTALAFAEQGARTAIADVDAEGGRETVDLITAAGGEAILIECDVSKSDDVEAMVTRVLDAYGGLDCAYNNAGIEGEMTPLGEITEEAWDRTIDINLKGVWLCMKYELPAMLERGGGAIVNCSSAAGLVGFRTLGPYCAAKGGVIMLTKAAALEYAEAGIRINAVCPGIIRTPLMEQAVTVDPAVEAQYLALEPVGRFGEATEIASSVLWLCGDGASFVTGHALSVDGGFTAQ